MSFLKHSKKAVTPLLSVYSIPIKMLSGEALNLSLFKGKFILIVNVASKCGFTKQYKQLNYLYKAYKSQLIVLGVPCNQFANQEPGTATDIKNFCEIHYGIEFILTEKIDVKGVNTHALYKWLTQKSINGKKNSNVIWNFQKYLISPKGELLDYFYSTTTPTSKKITQYLN